MTQALCYFLTFLFCTRFRLVHTYLSELLLGDLYFSSPHTTVWESGGQSAERRQRNTLGFSHHAEKALNKPADRSSSSSSSSKYHESKQSTSTRAGFKYCSSRIKSVFKMFPCPFLKSTHCSTIHQKNRSEIMKWKIANFPQHQSKCLYTSRYSTWSTPTFQADDALPVKLRCPQSCQYRAHWSVSIRWYIYCYCVY